MIPANPGSPAIALSRSKPMIAALILSALAMTAVGAAYYGEWRLMHVEYPGEFPNNPDTDQGFRLLKIYWIAEGGNWILLGVLFWVVGLLLYSVAGIRRNTSLSSWPGLVCAVFHVVLGCYALWFFL